MVSVVKKTLGRELKLSSELVPFQEIDVYAKGHSIRPTTDGQKRYVDAVFENDLTFCIGPAGTGKTRGSGWMVAGSIAIREAVRSGR